MVLSNAEKLMHSTVRLECRRKDGSTITGTSFFFSFKVGEKTQIPLIVTNKHVIEDSISGEFVLTKSNGTGPIVGEYTRIALDNFEKFWIKHPDQDIDLAVFPVAPLYKAAGAAGLNFYSVPFFDSQIPTEAQLQELSGLENITMIGYPNGIWDQKNNLPIIRTGVTATSPKYDYNGRPDFLIDCACFPGSSGSPVLIFDEGGWVDANGNFNLKGRIYLLGALYAGPQHIAPGEVQTIDVPLQNITISLSKIPNNLGFVVKARKLLEFRNMLQGNG